jgi:hypothetical protein
MRIQLRRAGLTVGRALIALAFACFAIGRADAQTAEVTRNLVLHSTASSAGAPLEHLQPPAQVTVLESEPTKGYLHVRTAAGNDGWAYANSLRLIPSAPPEAPPASAAAGFYDQLDPTWPKPTPNGTDFTSIEGNSCGASGAGGDSATNGRKDRGDEPAAYFQVSFDAVADLPFPQAAPRSRAKWSADQVKVIAPYEGVPLTITGYLVDQIKEEGKETANCGLTEHDEVDWHMYLTRDFVADDGKLHKGEAVIVETTPRIRPKHPNWHLDVLRRWVNKNQPVRISGWLLLDPEHQSDIGQGHRATIWEIHPITHIEVSEVEHPSETDWKDLEDEQ